MNENKFGFVEVLGGALLVAGLFLVFKFFPVYSDNMEVTQALRGLLGISWNLTDEQVHAQLQGRFGAIGSHTVQDESGALRDVPGMDIPSDAVTIERDERANTLRLSATYERQVDLKPLQKIVTVHFHPTVEGPLTPPTN